LSIKKGEVKKKKLGIGNGKGPMKAKSERLSQKRGGTTSGKRRSSEGGKAAPKPFFLDGKGKV